MRRFTILATFSAAATLSLSASADVITDWNGTAIEAARSFANPNPASYAVLVAHLAAYDAINAIRPTGHEFLSDADSLHAQGSESLDAAAAQAFHDVLVKLIVARASDIDAALVRTLAAIPDGADKVEGAALGAAAAAAILDARKADVLAPEPAPAPFLGEESVGKWRPTPREAVANAPLPGNTPWWVDVAPFALATSDAFDPGAPPGLASERYASDYDEVKILGSKTGSTRTADQTASAKFWAQQTHVPFNAIARSLALRQKLSITENARLFAQLNLALADSRIAGWQAKYKYLAWRPITAINFQGDDGNAATVPFPAPTEPSGPTWVPLLETPNHPEYPSGHSGTGAAGAGVLASWFGDETAFTVGSDSYLGYTRSFTKLSQAAKENADSRIYGGIHFRYANDAGLALGAKIAQHVTATYLKADPLLEPGAGGAGGQPSEGGAATDAGAGPIPSAGTGGSGGDANGGSNAGAGTPSLGAGGDPAGEGGAPANGGDASGGLTPSPPGKSDDSGCSVGRGNQGTWGSLLLAALALTALIRRRR